MFDRFAYWTAWVTYIVIVPILNSLLQFAIYNWFFGTKPPTPIPIYKLWSIWLPNLASVCYLAWLYYELQMGEDWEELNG